MLTALLKYLFSAHSIGGSFKENLETTETAFFSKDEPPENLATEKVTKEQLFLCFEANDAKNWTTLFD